MKFHEFFRATSDTISTKNEYQLCFGTANCTENRLTQFRILAIFNYFNLTRFSTRMSWNKRSRWHACIFGKPFHFLHKEHPTRLVVDTSTILRLTPTKLLQNLKRYIHSKPYIKLPHHSAKLLTGLERITREICF